MIRRSWHCCTTSGCCLTSARWGVSRRPYFAFAVAILYDRNQIFPKWLAYVTFGRSSPKSWRCRCFVSKAGPFAWNGSISFWMGTVIFGFWLMLRDRLSDEGQSSASPSMNRPWTEGSEQTRPHVRAGPRLSRESPRCAVGR